MSAEVIKGRYVLETCLQSRDGQSTYRARDRDEEQTVIVKILDLSRISDWQALESFDREVETLAQLQHPAIPRLLDHFRNDTRAYLVQEAITGHSLRERFDAGPLREAEALDFAAQGLEILSYLQSLNPPVIHRDIKPENLLLDATGKLWLIDFGAVRDAARQHQLSVAGTFGYMAPEQAAGRVEPASDLYALGVTLIEGLSGTHPNALPQDQELRLRFQDRISVSERLMRWLTLMTDPVARQRPANAREALHWLQAESPSESAGRLELSFPDAQRTQLSLTPTGAVPEGLKGLLQALARQSLLFLGSWFVLMFILHFVYNFFVSNPIYYIGVFNSLLMLSTFALLGWLVQAEYQARQHEARNQLSLVLDGKTLQWGSTHYALGDLREVVFGRKYHLQTPARTQIYLKFEGQAPLSLPVELSAAERQLFVHGLLTHGRKHLNQSDLSALTAATRAV